jgi:hypothetical protein
MFVIQLSKMTGSVVTGRLKNALVSDRLQLDSLDGLIIKLLFHCWKTVGHLGMKVDHRIPTTLKRV